MHSTRQFRVMRRCIGQQNQPLFQSCYGIRTYKHLSYVQICNKADSGLVRVVVGNSAIENYCPNLGEWCLEWVVQQGDASCCSVDIEYCVRLIGNIFVLSNINNNLSGGLFFVLLFEENLMIRKFIKKFSVANGKIACSYCR